MDSMDIGRFEKTSWAKQSWAEATEEEWGEEDPWEVGAEGTGGVLAAMDTTCHKCGGIGHYATECPSKGAGTGNDSGGKKGGKNYGGKFGGKDGGGKKGGKSYGGKFSGKGFGKDGKGPREQVEHH